MKYSIIIVAYMAEDKLLKCLQSLIDNPPETRQYSVKADAEIIIVDNSPQMLLGTEHNRLFTRLCQVYTRVLQIPHPENIGFAAGCNEGVKYSGGDYVVLMNPDTEVFPEWSERMSLHMGPKIGAVGPISNFVAGFQNMYFHMKHAKDWATQAKYAIKGMHRRAMETKLLIGFFMMIRRTVWEELGGMDPQFFLGCDDLDLSMRIREAGYDLLIATDVFVYHEGHASFYAAGSKSLELNKQAEKLMLAKLQAKYGDTIPTSTELWGCEILPTYVPKRQTLSISVIVRDDLANMGEMLKSVYGLADEIVIVETEPNAAKAMSAAQGYNGYLQPSDSVLFFPWTDSFAEAKNYSLSKCTGDWVLWLDADDRVSPESAALIRAAMDNPGPMTQAKTCHFGFVLRDDGPDGFNYAEGQPRLFPRVPGLEWEGRVHESYMDAAARLGIEKVDCDIIIDHTGYKDPALMLKKHARNLRLMKMEPASPKKYYHMGKNLMALGEMKAAEECFREVLEREWAAPLENPFRDQVRHCMASLIMATREADESIDAYLENNSKPDSLFLRAEVALKRGQVFEAEAMYKEYLSLQGVKDPHGCNWGMLSAAAESRLALIQETRERVYAG